MPKRFCCDIEFRCCFFQRPMSLVLLQQISLAAADILKD